MPKFNVINNPTYGLVKQPKKLNFRVKKQVGKEVIRKFKNPRDLKTHFKSEVNIEDLLIFAPEEPEEKANEYAYETPNLEDMDEDEAEDYLGKRTAMARIGKKRVVRAGELEEWLREKDFNGIADAVNDVDGGSDNSFWLDKGGRYFYELDLAENKNINDPAVLNAMKFWNKYHKNNNKFLTFNDIRDELGEEEEESEDDIEAKWAAEQSDSDTEYE